MGDAWQKPVFLNGWENAARYQPSSPVPWPGPSTIFTLPPGYRPLERPRHYLVIHPGEKVWGREWEIEHDPSCPFDIEFVKYAGSGRTPSYRCAVADEVGYNGIDHLEADDYGGEWTSLLPGRYEIEAYSYQTGEYGEHIDHGLRVVRRVPEIIATVISV